MLCARLFFFLHDMGSKPNKSSNAPKRRPVPHTLLLNIHTHTSDKHKRARAREREREREYLHHTLDPTKYERCT